MTIKKFRLFLASNVNKEEQWLTDMSERGFHFYKYKFGFYYFEEDPNVSYIYQIDFLQDADEAYYQLYEDARWEHQFMYLNAFQYFRIKADNQGIKKIYSDEGSLVDSLKRMIGSYLILFLTAIVMQIILLSMWRGNLIDFITNSLVFTAILLHFFIIISLGRRVYYHRRKS